MATLETMVLKSSEWTSTNPIVPDGVIGIETDTKKSKLGNGISRWSELPYFVGKKEPQTLEYGANIDMDYEEGEDAIITLEGDVTELNLQNVPQQGIGDIEVVQDGTGGYGIQSIVHEGLTVKYVAGEAPIAANINSDPNGHSVISYKRIGNFIYVSYAGF